MPATGSFASTTSASPSCCSSTLRRSSSVSRELPSLPESKRAAGGGGERGGKWGLAEAERGVGERGRRAGAGGGGSSEGTAWWPKGGSHRAAKAGDGSGSEGRRRDAERGRELPKVVARGAQSPGGRPVGPRAAGRRLWAVYCVGEGDTGGWGCLTDGRQSGRAPLRGPAGPLCCLCPDLRVAPLPHSQAIAAEEAAGARIRRH